MGIEGGGALQLMSVGARVGERCLQLAGDPGVAVPRLVPLLADVGLVALDQLHELLRRAVDDRHVGQRRAAAAEATQRRCNTTADKLLSCHSISKDVASDTGGGAWINNAFTDLSLENNIAVSLDKK